MPLRAFTSADFDLFEIPEFGARMAAIRGDLRPTLLALGQELAGPLAELMDGPLFPHAASHMRRRVNPPAETWVAFGREARGYKRWTHLRVAVSQAGVRVVVFVEDDADDKSRFAQALKRDAKGLLQEMPDPRLLWYTLTPPEGEPPHTRDLSIRRLTELGRYLGRTKTAKFQAGIPLGRDGAARAAPVAFRAAVLDAAEALRPLYRAGVG